MTKENNIKTGLEGSADIKNDEYNLVASLLEASNYKMSDDQKVKINITRHGKFLFSFEIRPVSEDESQACRKKAAIMMKNPNGPKYPQIVKETDLTKYNNYLIYTATVDEDKKKIWGNQEVKSKCGILEDPDTIDYLLLPGEKSRVIDKILEISGFLSDSIDNEEYIKN